MPRELELGKALRDEAYHLRVVVRELRNRATTLAKAIDDAATRIDGLIDELESDDPTPKGAQGYERDRDRADSRAVAAR